MHRTIVLLMQLTAMNLAKTTIANERYKLWTDFGFAPEKSLEVAWLCFSVILLYISFVTAVPILS